jgi:hypothetical protein
MSIRGIEYLFDELKESWRDNLWTPINIRATEDSLGRQLSVDEE